MKRLIALLLICALFCFAGCASPAAGDVTQDTTGQGTENSQPESITAGDHQGTMADKTGKDNHNPNANSQQNALPQTLRTRATAEECDRSLDVAAVLPRFGVYENGRMDYGTHYVAFLCQCATVSGERVWMYISVEDYIAFFDPEASATNCRFAYSDMAAFAQPVRVSCATVEAESLAEGLSAQTGEQVLLFGEAHSGIETDVAAVMYTNELPPMTCVYADAMTIEPVFLLANGCAEENTDVICRVTALDGSTVWVAMTVEDYTDWIDPEADLTAAGQTETQKVTYQMPLRIYGVAVDAEVIAGGLRDSIGSTTAVCFVAVARD